MQTKHPILTPFQRKSLHKALKLDLRPEFHMRIAIMLLADEGKSQSQICQQLSCAQATARHWMTIARSGLAHTWQEQPVGRPHTTTEEYLKRLQELVGQSPREHGYGFKRWTAQWLGKHLSKEFGIDVSARHINRLLRQMGLSTRGSHTSVMADKKESPDNCDDDLALNSNIKILNLTKTSLKAGSVDHVNSLFLKYQSS